MILIYLFSIKISHCLNNFVPFSHNWCILPRIFALCKFASSCLDKAKKCIQKTQESKNVAAKLAHARGRRLEPTQKEGIKKDHLTAKRKQKLERGALWRTQTSPRRPHKRYMKNGSDAPPQRRRWRGLFVLQRCGSLLNGISLLHYFLTATCSPA